MKAGAGTHHFRRCERYACENAPHHCEACASGRTGHAGALMARVDTEHAELLREIRKATLRAFVRRRVRHDGYCWVWTGHVSRKTGYGQGSPRGERAGSLAHRLSYEAFVGPIPQGMTLDHACRNRPCVNPEHLEPVTSKENVLRGIGRSAVNARRRFCVAGHPLSGDNLYTRPNSHRACRACRREADRARPRSPRESETQRLRRARKRAARMEAAA